MQDVYDVGFDGEQYAIKMRFPSVEELTHFKIKTHILGRNWTSFRKFDFLDPLRPLVEWPRLARLKYRCVVALAEPRCIPRSNCQMSRISV